MAYHEMKKQSKNPQTDESVFQKLDINEASIDINIPKDTARPIDDTIQEGAIIINNEAVDKELLQDASPNAVKEIPRVDTDLHINNEGTRQSSRRPKLSDRYLQYGQPNNQ
jgi:hypothetical protein